ncbi:hypothetical protein [Oleiharenicola lentus]|uniref:hypothetical protein n=1 Tax=Oleiharenicola lentus TaxID=2508720 RepID=UPI003F6645FC
MFEEFFIPAQEASDGFLQEEREALLDMIHYCFFSGNTAPPFDCTVSFVEVAPLNWDPAVPYGQYERRSAYLALKAKRDLLWRDAFIASIHRRLNLPEKFDRAGVLCQAVVRELNALEV